MSRNAARRRAERSVAWHFRERLRRVNPSGLVNNDTESININTNINDNNIYNNSLLIQMLE